jgi:coenzyme F420-reducing hydrogenase gamma subunit
MGEVSNLSKDTKLENSKMSELEKKKEALKLKRSRIEHQERLLKLKERKNRTRLLIEVGGVASKAGIDHLNTNTLLGAFLEIKEKEKDEVAIKRWTKKGAEALDVDMKQNGEPLIVTFAEEPEKAVMASD